MFSALLDGGIELLQVLTGTEVAAWTMGCAGYGDGTCDAEHKNQARMTQQKVQKRRPAKDVDIHASFPSPYRRATVLGFQPIQRFTYATGDVLTSPVSTVYWRRCATPASTTPPTSGRTTFTPPSSVTRFSHTRRSVSKLTEPAPYGTTERMRLLKTARPC